MPCRAIDAFIISLTLFDFLAIFCFFISAIAMKRRPIGAFERYDTYAVAAAAVVTLCA